MLDAILSPEWEDRIYSYTADWGDGTAATEIRDGSGNDCFIVFTPPDGAFIKGLDHESPMAPGPKPPTGAVARSGRRRPRCLRRPGHRTGVRQPRRSTQRHLLHVAPTPRHRVASRGGRALPRPRGSRRPPTAPGRCSACSPTPPPPRSRTEPSPRPTSKSTPDPVAVDHVFNLRPLTRGVVRRINPQATLEELGADITSANYPT